MSGDCTYYCLGLSRESLENGSRKARERPDASSVRNDAEIDAGNDAENDAGNDAENDTLHTMPEVRTIPPVGSCGKYTAKMKNVLQK